MDALHHSAIADFQSLLLSLGFFSPSGAVDE